MIPIKYYLDPGSGFVFGQGAGIILGLLLTILGAAFVFLKAFFRKFFKFFLIIFILTIIIITGGALMHKPQVKTKIIILGIDAMDPNITEQLMEQGKLPNFSSLRKQGSYSHLKTSIPAESAVAWTNFATGVNPGSHGVYDFIMRNPDNYMPYLSLSEVSSGINGPEIKTRRKAKPFWYILSKNKIPAFIYFCPNTFPAETIYGNMISGMGTPDITGTMGKFSFYTSEELSSQDKDSRGRIVKVDIEGSAINTQLYGPKVAAKNTSVETILPFRIDIANDKKGVWLNFQGNRIFLQEGTFSDWQKIYFKVGFFKKIHGIAKFYLKSIRPVFELYCSPINFDPCNPPFAISYPKSHSSYLAKKTGLYYTQGMPYDTWALTEDRLDEKTFLELSDEILKEHQMILEQGLKDFKNGVFFFYFETLDVIQHMFWRYLDNRHPLYEKDSIYKDTIFKYYEKMDEILGKVLKTMDKDTTLIVLSDHGFNSFRKSLHLNRWLLENGYLTLSGGSKDGKEFFENVDWSRTKAYALGFGSIYLNMAGREGYGIVIESEAKDIKKSIAEGLKKLIDNQSGENIVSNVYLQEDVFSGPCLRDAPDLVVGFNRGYRASWQTALGATPQVLMEDNNKKWSGDHLIDPELVPGVLFVNKKTLRSNLAIQDIASLVLSFFNITR